MPLSSPEFCEIDVVKVIIYQIASMNIFCFLLHFYSDLEEFNKAAVTVVVVVAAAVKWQWVP
jgi:hypothetical protein